MTSAAKYLHDFFTADAEEQTGRDFRRLIEAMYELEDELLALEIIGANVKSFLALLPRLRSTVNSHLNNDLSQIHVAPSPGGYRSPIRLDDAELGLLDLAVEKTALAEGSLSEDRSELIRVLLAEVKKQVAGDETLDPQLRLFIARALLAVEAALTEYETTGEFRLRDALLTLFGLLRTAEASSEQPGRWKETWEKYGAPTTVGLIASIPQLALSGAALLQALGN